MDNSVQTYGFNEGIQISPHFNSNEFQCPCGQKHDILIDLKLVDRLEELYSKLDCDSIIIINGYRCRKHDKAIGGSGMGIHTKGKAVDIICRSKDKIGDTPITISSIDVSCEAQNIGFDGIINVDNTYTTTHLDMRGSKWYGDETQGTNFSVKDLNEYYDEMMLTPKEEKPDNNESLNTPKDPVDNDYQMIIDEVYKKFKEENEKKKYETVLDKETVVKCIDSLEQITQILKRMIS